MERRFVIIEVTLHHSLKDRERTITESELKRRLEDIIDRPLLTAEGAIDILLHGEKEA